MSTFKIQKNIIRIIANISNRTTCKLAFKSLRIQTVPSLYIYKSILYVFGNKHLFSENKSIHSYNTRQIDDIHTVQQNFSHFQKSVYIKCSQLYNKLPLEYRVTKKWKITTGLSLTTFN